MAVGKPTPIPFPSSSFPGGNSQESAGRLINVYMEPLGDNGPAKEIWRRCAGLSQFAASANSGYRGGMVAKNLSYEAWANNASTVDSLGTVSSIGSLPGTKKISIAQNQASPVPDVVAVDLDNGAYVLNSAAVQSATATATVGGSSFVSGDTVNLIFLNPYNDNFPVTISYTLGAGSSASIIASNLNSQINANGILSAAHLTSSVIGAALTISQQGAIGNSTSMTYSTSGTGNETITFNPSSGGLTGGQGTYGAFTGVPTAYSGQGNLPQPNSVAFQDGYFFFTVANGEVYATSLNGLTMNALTYITVQAKSDVTLLRGIAFSGLMFFFTTGSCEVWQDQANAAPAFPYGRITVLEIGLAQPGAIAGSETGFSELIWVAQDNGVYWMTSGSMNYAKISPPDLDRLIRKEIDAGNTIEAQCYVADGKKFWALSSPNWTWEFNLQTKKWNERWSINAANGVFGAWRARGGHLAFGKWLVGDSQSGNILYIDPTNYTENGAVQLCRLESGPVRDFPNQIRVARADFDFVFGVGIATLAVTDPSAADPMTAISMSKDGGNTWGNPLLRSLGAQAKTKRGRASVKNMGLSGPSGVRWRIDVSDPVYFGFMGGTQSSDPRVVGP